MGDCAQQPALPDVARLEAAPPFFPRARSSRSQMWRGWKPHCPFFRGLEARAPRCSRLEAAQPFFPRAGSPRSQAWRGWKPHCPFFRGLEARAPRRRARSGVCAICGQLPSTVKRTSRETCDELRARQRDRRCRGRDFPCDSAVPLHGHVLATPAVSSIRFDFLGVLWQNPWPLHGRVAERSIAAVLKTVDPQGSGGSNPSPSASFSQFARL